MNPNKVVREKVKTLLDLPNIGKASATDLVLLDIHTPQDLIGKCPYAMHAELCIITGVRHDPCVIDVFISVTKFMSGEAAKPWWFYTQERKETQRRVHKNLKAKLAK
jgi:hypothetical protein